MVTKNYVYLAVSEQTKNKVVVDGMNELLVNRPHLQGMYISQDYLVNAIIEHWLK